MNTHHPRCLFRGGHRRLLFVLVCSSLLSVSLRGDAPPAPLSSTLSGVFVDTGPDDGTNFRTHLDAYDTWFKDGATNWSREPVGSVLVFGDMLSWKRMMGNLGWMKGSSRWGGAGRPLVWSLPLFPWVGQGGDNWATATSSLPEVRFEAEGSGVVLEANASIISHSEASAVEGANQDQNNAVSIPTTWGAVRFTNLALPQTVDHVRVSYRATAAGSMDVMINGSHVKSVNFPSTLIHGWKSGQTTTYVFQELRITGLTLAPGDSVKLYSNSNDAFQVDYIAFGNYAEWYRRAANLIKDFRPGDPVIFVRPGWEFTGDWYPWAAGGHEADFAIAFQRVVSAFRSVSPRFRFDWCAAFVEQFTSTRPNPELCYPGDGYVDIVGLDLYDSEKWEGDLNGDGHYDDAAEAELRWNHYVNAGCGLDWVRRFASRHGKLIGLAEWGVSGDNRDDNGTLNEAVPTDNPEFVHRMQRWLAENRAIYHHYWNSNAGYKGKLSDNSPTPTADAYLFDFSFPLKLDSGADAPPANTSDEFDRSIPRAQWTVGNPDHAAWSLTAQPGRLRLTSNGTHFQASTASNVILQAAPHRDFEIVTRVDGKPGGAGQACGLLVYGDNNHYVHMVRQGPNAFVFGTEVNDVTSETQATDSLGPVAYLKIARVGANYTGYFSADGVNWTPVGGNQTLASTEPRVALVCYGPAGFAAEFDTFHVNKLEAEHGVLTNVDVGDNAAISGEKFAGWWATVGDKVEWKQVPGGSALAVRYSAAAAGTKGLYIDDVLVQRVAFPSTGSTYSYQTLPINVPVPAGATVKLQHDSGDGAWNLDYLTLTYAPKYEAEEAATEGVTYRDDEPGASNDGAVWIKSAEWGAVKFTQLPATSSVTLRYRSTAGGTIQYSVNGGAPQNLTLPASATFSDRVLNVTIPAGGSIKFSKNNAVSFVVDHLVIRP